LSSASSVKCTFGEKGYATVALVACVCVQELSVSCESLGLVDGFCLGSGQWRKVRCLSLERIGLSWSMVIESGKGGAEIELAPK